VRATVTLAAADQHDSAFDAPADAATGDVIGALLRAAGHDPAVALERVTIDGRPIDHQTRVAASGLRSGAVVEVGGMLSRAVPPPTPWRLVAAGGPAAGSTYPLPTGTTVIGRDPACDVLLTDPDVSRRHAAVTVTHDGVTVADLGSTNGTLLDGVHIDRDPRAVGAGTRLRLGESTLVLAGEPEPSVVLSPSGDGELTFNRPPRLDAPDPDAPPPVVDFPKPPPAAPTPKLPVVATVVPLVAGIALAAVMRRPEYLLFTALSPVLAVGQWLNERVTRRRSALAAARHHEAELAAARTRLAAVVREQTGRRRHASPDPATIAAIATTTSRRLWERRPRDADFLCLRLGSGDLPARVTLSNADDASAPLLPDVPVDIALREHGVVGVAGPLEVTARIARSVITQLATMHSPRDVLLCLLAEPARAAGWEWARWLPHLRPPPGAACQALLGTDPDSVSARIAELRALASEDGRRPRRDAEAQRAIVVVADGAHFACGVAGFAELLDAAPNSNVFVVCIDEDETRLPSACTAVATVTGEVATRLTLRVAGRQDLVLVADGIDVGIAERVARALAPVREHVADADAGLPTALRWRDLAGLPGDPDDLRGAIARRWQQPVPTTSVPLGVTASGPLWVDIARDGPHALVAGTTGSGKSELLQTLVVALAVSNAPDDVTFVLVDYKGGAAFGPCASLPHTVGVVTDLDAPLVERALVALTAELKRRESLLATARATDIAGYRAAGHRLARLVIVVDEFASLADELPEFVGGLIGVAQRGRSLGIHLVLATQRPEGVVSADIRANTNLRVCLGVTRDVESRDVIDVPDAAHISRTTPGRALLRTGHGELQTFQCARVAGHSATRRRAIDVRPSPFLALARPAPATACTAADDHAGGPSDLEALVDACRGAADHLAVGVPTPPWLPALPHIGVVPVRAARSTPLDHPQSTPLRAALGVRDVPERQTQEPYVVDLTTHAHLAIVGSARSGRTTALRTLAGALASTTSTADLHLYGIDCAGGALRPLVELPQCGAVVTADERDRTRRLVARLAAEAARRRAALARDGYGSISEQRHSSPAAWPHVVALLDGWEAFAATFGDVDGGAVIDDLFAVLRDGAAAGVHLVVTADRGGLLGRLASAVDRKLVLRLADRADFALAGIPARRIARDMPPGRGFDGTDNVETQLFLLDPDPSGPAQSAAIAEIAAIAGARDAGLPPSQRPRRVEPLPDAVELAALAKPVRHPADATTAHVVLGVGGDELDATVVDMQAEGGAFLIAGPARSGRTNALAVIATGLRELGWTTIAVVGKRSALAEHVDEYVDCFDATAGSTLHMRLATGTSTRTAVLVDDAERVADSVAAAALDRFSTSRDARTLLVVAATTDDVSIGFRGFLADVRRGRTGLLLAPRGPLDGEAFGVRLRRDVAGRHPPGRALLVQQGEVSAVQVALAPAAAPPTRQLSIVATAG
jgi:S-DNA-T family DNA segregation ATPase FtsK/SpoIIIE